mgnify:CR=1 FL=1
MAGTKEIKRRITSIKSTRKITKAMELVAASKMRRAVASALASRLYAGYSWEILASVTESLPEAKHPFFAERMKANGKDKILLILVTSTRGLCGAYNAQIIKKAISLLKIEQNGTSFDFISIGKKGDAAMHRAGQNIIASFPELLDKVSLSAVLPVSKLAMEEYVSGNYGKVFVAYTDFLSPLIQKPNIKQLLPVSKENLAELLENLGGEGEGKDILKQSAQKTEYLFEGDFHTLLSSLAEKITRMQVYQMALESGASEQSARMLAMKNASEASDEMIGDLTLAFNKARQANITREISEISAGMASVSP